MKRSLVVLSAMLCFSYFARAQSPQSLYVFTASASGAYPTSSNLQIPANIDSLNVRITGIATTQSWSAQIQTSPDGAAWTNCGSLVTATAASSGSGGACTPSGALYMRVSITAGTGGGTLYGALMGTCSLCQLSSSGGDGGGGGDTITTPNGTLAVGGSSSNTTVDVLKVPTTNTTANSAFYCLLSSVSTTSADQTPYVSPNCSFDPATGALAISGSGSSNVSIGRAGSATGTLTLESSAATGGVTLSPASAASQFTATVPAATDTIAELAQAQTLTNKTISGSTNTLSNIGNSSLTNSAITIAGTSVSLGGSTSSLPSPGAIGGTTPAAGSFTTLTATTINTTTHCAAAGSAASPSVASCSAAAAGFFSCATNASGATCVVDTSAVTANSVIQIQPDSSLGSALSVTCNTTADSGLTAPRVSARTAGTSFTITLGTFSTNPECFSYVVIN